MNETFYRELLDGLVEGVYFVDLDRKITFWNKAAERLGGYAAQEVIGKSCADNLLRHVDSLGVHLCSNGCPLAATSQDGQVREAEVFMHHKFGHRVPVTVKASPVRDDSGSIVGAAEVFFQTVKEINILSELEALRKEIYTDPLTGIGNRRFAEMTLKTLDSSLSNHGVPYGVLFADIDHFKTVNDTWGHHTGDLVLKMVANTLSKRRRSLDAVCRWGGEEFLLLVSNISPEALLGLAERLRVLVESSWLEKDGKRVDVTVSFGGAVSRPSETAESVVERADAELYKSKNSGRNRCSVVG